MGLSKIRKQFLILTFWGGILSQRQVCFFLNQHKILDCLIPYKTYFKKKKFTYQTADLNIFQYKNQKKDRNTTKLRKMPFLK
jgi:hypothetical protein